MSVGCQLSPWATGIPEPERLREAWEGGRGQEEGGGATGEDPESREATGDTEPSLANCGR